MTSIHIYKIEIPESEDHNGTTLWSTEIHVDGTKVKETLCQTEKHAKQMAVEYLNQ